MASCCEPPEPVVIVRWLLLGVLLEAIRILIPVINELACFSFVIANAVKQSSLTLSRLLRRKGTAHPIRLGEVCSLMFCPA